MNNGRSPWVVVVVVAAAAAVVVVVVAGGGLHFFRGGKFEPWSTCYAHSLLLALSTGL